MLNYDIFDIFLNDIFGISEIMLTFAISEFKSNLEHRRQRATAAQDYEDYKGHHHQVHIKVG